MSKSKLASKLAKMEGKKVQVEIGNIREVISCIETLAAQEAFDEAERYAPQSPTVKGLCEGIQRKLDRLWKKADKAAGKVV